MDLQRTKQSCEQGNFCHQPQECSPPNRHDSEEVEWPTQEKSHNHPKLANTKSLLVGPSLIAEYFNFILKSRYFPIPIYICIKFHCIVYSYCILFSH